MGSLVPCDSFMMKRKCNYCSLHTTDYADTEYLVGRLCEVALFALCINYHGWIIHLVLAGSILTLLQPVMGLTFFGGGLFQ